MQGHRVCDVERDDLRYKLNVFDKRGARKFVLVCEGAQRGPQHVVSSGAAKAGVEPECGFLFHGFSTRYEIVGIEVPAQQRLQVRHFEFLDQISVLLNDRRKTRQFLGSIKNGIDRLFQV